MNGRASWPDVAFLAPSPRLQGRLPMGAALSDRTLAMCCLKEAVNLEDKRGYMVKALVLPCYGSVSSGLRANSPAPKTVPVATGSPPVKCC
jgi:hypothetical protein